ncbi:TPA: ParB N-terminal domain-containing protein [Proteus mirabilis]|uniref:ParB N-terminal domain-containing protein n=1 Tax=Proteus mirabilis TaxID=584 RepID=UPI00158394AB|nr:ParB N-terminal domain-containing protein [Proteus mirabilis]EKX4458051.1 ParB N-terminal domain-containing protein [Proteus mirabilis]EKX4632922.1 ParB N-terminal domain-containing protein [Proteus mirabilis]ELB4967007.1 ParB N-terminal domain-containing protein [Proteus mirabilis]ELI8995187.1 ParB N-terminal domain-containing protein [Proteus mirabilis]MCY9777428.1 ParB N-terminal domain-containing protein [Proteus mirabilis]
MYKLELINLELIQETEEHIPDRVIWLKEKILEEGTWKVPLLLEENSLAIMDGHHRFNAAKKLGLKRIPAVLLSYSSPYVQVISWRDDFYIDKDIVISYIKNKKLFPLKTTRHVISPTPEEINIPLSFLY